MEPYSNEEYADMHFMYGRAEGNALEAARLYRQQYPVRRHPESCHLQGSISALGRGAGRPARITSEVEDIALEAVRLSPGTSTGRIATQVLVLSRSTVWRILHRNSLYPHHLQRIQYLSDPDIGHRVIFCQWIQHRLQSTIVLQVTFYLQTMPVSHAMVFLIFIIHIFGVK